MWGCLRARPCLHDARSVLTARAVGALKASLDTCAGDCGTLYGRLNGTVLESAPAASAGDCCNSCKGTAGCNTWNYCYCDLGCAGGLAKGTCVLQSQGNAFYPRCAPERGVPCHGTALIEFLGPPVWPKACAPAPQFE